MEGIDGGTVTLAVVVWLGLLAIMEIEYATRVARKG